MGDIRTGSRWPRPGMGGHHLRRRRRNHTHHTPPAAMLPMSPGAMMTRWANLPARRRRFYPFQPRHLPALRGISGRHGCLPHEGKGDAAARAARGRALAITITRPTATDTTCRCTGLCNESSRTRSRDAPNVHKLARWQYHFPRLRMCIAAAACKLPDIARGVGCRDLCRVDCAAVVGCLGARLRLSAGAAGLPEAMKEAAGWRMWRAA